MYRYNRKGTSKCDLYCFLLCPLFGVSIIRGSIVIYKKQQRSKELYDHIIPTTIQE